MYQGIILGVKYMNVKTIIKTILSTRWKLIVSISVIMLFSVGVIIFSPLIVRQLINLITDSVVSGTVIQPGVLVFWTVLLVTLVTLNFILEGQRSAKMLVFGNEITTELSKNTYSSILRSEQLDINKFDKDLLLNSVLHKSAKIGHQYFGKNILNSIYEVLLLTSVIITVLTINPWFGLATVVALPLYQFITKQLDRFANKKQIQNDDINQKMDLLLKENLDQIKNIKILNGVKEEEVRFQNILDKMNKTYRQLNSINHYNSGLIGKFLLNLILALAVGIGSYFALLNDLTTLGSLVATLILIPYTFPSLRRLIDTKIRPSFIASEVEDINNILSLKPENRGDTVQQLDEIYSFKFSEVNFDYGRDTKFAMTDINFELKKGEKLGVLGLAKSGKTTLSDLITKIVRVKQGSISINNCDINKINTYYLRELIAIVPQEAKLFHGTIEENIRYPYSFDEYKYNDALNKCRLKLVINNLEKRDKTIVDDETTLLSPSEKQKIALANALYKDSKIVVLDEATSKMDSAAEQEITEEIYKLKNKIVIMISNRIHNLTKCDKILILNNGRVVEYGKTSDLLDNKKSTFAKMMSEYEKSKTRVG